MEAHLIDAFYSLRIRHLPIVVSMSYHPSSKISKTFQATYSRYAHQIFGRTPTSNTLYYLW